MTASILPSLLAFVAVLAMIPLALWLMKRTQGLRPRASGPLSMVAGLSLGPRERIAVVQAAGRYLVVGITGQSITLLSELPEWPGDQPAEASTAPGLPASPVFARLLRGLERRDADRPDR